eukprot:1161056-Pelagomonas_calceolata.AAC.4
MERSGALELAPWVWLPWLPQLQMALARPVGVPHSFWTLPVLMDTAHSVKKYTAAVCRCA